jgi:hypothetical protein
MQSHSSVQTQMIRSGHMRMFGLHLAAMNSELLHH